LLTERTIENPYYHENPRVQSTLTVAIKNLIIFLEDNTIFYLRNGVIHSRP